MWAAPWVLPSALYALALNLYLVPLGIAIQVLKTGDGTKHMRLRSFWGNQIRGRECGGALPSQRVMKLIYIAITAYLLLGVLGYWGNSSTTGIELVGGKKPSLIRRIFIVMLWPLAMIGAIEA